jgi:hypothetical protein
MKSIRTPKKEPCRTAKQELNNLTRLYQPEVAEYLVTKLKSEVADLKAEVKALRSAPEAISQIAAELKRMEELASRLERPEVEKALRYYANASNWCSAISKEASRCYSYKNGSEVSIRVHEPCWGLTGNEIPWKLAKEALGEF